MHRLVSIGDHRHPRATGYAITEESYDSTILAFWLYVNPHAQLDSGVVNSRR